MTEEVDTKKTAIVPFVGEIQVEIPGDVDESDRSALWDAIYDAMGDDPLAGEAQNVIHVEFEFMDRVVSGNVVNFMDRVVSGNVVNFMTANEMTVEW